MPAKILPFVSRSEQLRLRGMRNFSRYMLLTKKFVEADGPERAEWHREAAAESKRDAEWNRRHGPVSGGASVLQWRHDAQAKPDQRHRTADPHRVGQRSRSQAHESRPTT
jgi:hypothetical protein